MKRRNFRQYPTGVRRIRELSLSSIATFSQLVATADTSTGHSVTERWAQGRASLLVADEERYELYILPYEQEFISLLMTEDFSLSVRNASTRFVNRLVKNHQMLVKEWIQRLYFDHQGDVDFVIQLFRLLRCFPYQFLYPASLNLAGLAVHHNSDYVKSEALSLLDHWGNADVFQMLQFHEPPETPWLRVKYCAIRQTLERNAAIPKD